MTDHLADMEPHKGPFSLLAIGGSAGSFPAMIDWIKFNRGPSVVLIIHRSKEHKSNLVNLLQHYTTFAVKEPTEGEKLQSGHVYISPPGLHLVLDEQHCWRLLDTAPVFHCKPAIDVLFSSLADNFLDALAGIILSGANDDGGKGLKQLKDAGAFTLCMDPVKADYSNMPNAAKKHKAVMRYFDQPEIKQLCAQFFSA